MNREQIDFYRSGYWECRQIIIQRLKSVLARKIGLRSALTATLKQLECEADEDHWRTIQDECPGITREQYAAGLVADAKAIRDEFYTKAGFLKPRLVRNMP